MRFLTPPAIGEVVRLSDSLTGLLVCRYLIQDQAAPNRPSSWHNSHFRILPILNTVFSIPSTVFSILNAVLPILNVVLPVLNAVFPILNAVFGDF